MNPRMSSPPLGVHLESSLHCVRLRVNWMGEHFLISDFGVFGDDLGRSFRIG